MNKESNIYTFTFAVIMVLIIGIVLAVTSEVLQPFKKQNKKDKKMMDILSAINIDANRENAQQEYDKYDNQNRYSFQGKVYDESHSPNTSVIQKSLNFNKHPG